MPLPRPACLLPALLIASTVVHADEGMWTPDNFPAAMVRERLGVDITPEWLRHVRLATVRLSGCTASFVSPDGLMLTNHHCVASCLAQLSTAGNDLVHEGFIAAGRDGELRCPTQRADVLMGTQDITAEVQAAMAGRDDAAANEARKQALTRLEKSCEQAAAGTRDPRRCEAVTLYGGGQYFLYQYRRFDDVRIVFAPESAIGFFGGDPDNFQFPRWTLDMALLRAWDNDAPAKSPAHLPVNWEGPADGEAVFVSGHPGSTQRLLTVAQLESERAKLPFWLLRASELRGRYIEFSRRGTEAARIAKDPLFSVENRIKVRRRQLDALLDSAAMEKKRAAEQALRAAATFPAGADPWVQIERAMAREQQLHVPYTFIEGAAGFDSALFGYARALVRGAAERAKPDEQRLREFVDTALPRIEQQLFADVPVYAARELLTLSFGLARMREYLGPDHPLVRNLLAEFSPEELARGLVLQSRLDDAAVRRQLWEGGAAAIEASDDPMIRIARLVDAEARALRQQYEDEVEAVVTTATQAIAATRFAQLGTSVYPDATFTLRINPGVVQGWNEAGTDIAPFTTLARAFERATGTDPFRLPDSWLSKREALDPGTRMNFVTTNDIVGGNSGSPLVNARGEVVGLAFDGNIHSISGAYWHDAARNRAVAVHPAIMRLALTQVYPVAHLLGELGLRP